MLPLMLRVTIERVDDSDAMMMILLLLRRVTIRCLLLMATIRCAARYDVD